MFLLKPTRRALPASGSPLFTFHNVSIKTKDCPSIPRVHIALHSTMFLLKPIAGLFVNATDCTLHSTMFLLKLAAIAFARATDYALHSTMFLLKPEFIIAIACSGDALHSTMFLLKPNENQPVGCHAESFIFHNVSIKTRRLFPNSHGHGHSLHSTMFLLKPVWRRKLRRPYSKLYIPQCFY